MIGNEFSFNLLNLSDINPCIFIVFGMFKFLFCFVELTGLKKLFTARRFTNLVHHCLVFRLTKQVYLEGVPTVPKLENKLSLFIQFPSFLCFPYSFNFSKLFDNIEMVQQY